MTILRRLHHSDRAWEEDWAFSSPLSAIALQKVQVKVHDRL
jgi:hypothetical protein